MAVFDRHNIGDLRGQTVIFSAANVLTITEAIQQITGFDAGEMPVGSVVVAIAKLTDQAGLGVKPGGAVTTAGSAPVKFGNPTAGTITPTAGDKYTVIWIKNSE